MIKVLRLDSRFINKQEELKDFYNIDSISYKNLIIGTSSIICGESYEEEYYLNVYTKNQEETIYFEDVKESLKGNFFYILYNEKQDIFIILTKQDFQIIKESLEYEFIKIKELEY